MDNKHKYYKYKSKYLNEKILVGGGNEDPIEAPIEAPIEDKKVQNVKSIRITRAEQRKQEQVQGVEHVRPVRLTRVEERTLSKQNIQPQNNITLKKCAIKWMIGSNTKLSNRLITLSNQFDCAFKTDRLHMTVAFCEIDNNIYLLIRDEMEKKVQEILKTGEFTNPINIKEKKYVVQGKYVIIEYFESSVITHIIYEIRKLILDMVINKCTELYLPEEGNIDNYMYMVDRKADTITKIENEQIGKQELPSTKFDSKTIFFYVNGKWKHILDIQYNKFWPHISIATNGKTKCINTSLIETVAIKPNNEEFVFDEKDFVKSSLIEKY